MTTTEQHSDSETLIAATLISMEPDDTNLVAVLPTLVIDTEARDAADQTRLYQTPVPRDIRYFQRYGVPMVPRQINEQVRDLVGNSSKELDRRVGYVYCFSHPDSKDIDDTLGPEILTVINPIKIGHSRNVGRRMKQWRSQCRYEPVQIFQYRMREHVRIEAIVHAQLYNSRRREHKGCARCHGQHDEWFDVDREYAEYLVRLWQSFTNHLDSPYDAEGQLVARWRERLQYADMDDENCWTWFARLDVDIPFGTQTRN